MFLTHMKSICSHEKHVLFYSCNVTHYVYVGFQPTLHLIAYELCQGVTCEEKSMANELYDLNGKA